MKRFFFLAASLLWGAASFAQQALGPGTGIVSPEINADNTVTFRYYNPKAITVQVSGDFLPSQKITYERDGLAQLGEMLSDEDSANLLYGTFLQGQISTYVEKGRFLSSTRNLISLLKSNNGTVPESLLSRESTAGATDDVEIIKLERNVPQRIRMFIWLEGQDIDCVDSVSSSRFAINIELAGGDE